MGYVTDDLNLLSHTHEQMYMMTTSAAATASESLGLNIHKGKSKILKYNMECTDTISLEEEDLQDVEPFMYIVSSIIDIQGGSDAEGKVMIGKVRQHSYSWRTCGTQNNCQPISKSIRTSKQFSYMEVKHGELLQPSSKRDKYLYKAVYTRSK
ncbi:unnamed protein product [Schistosoma margrebowiei]|uniref:Uncharacterized protein n=1 Tax=Schistosoma margrebowiei TaxID=48269 RepID=A0A183M7C4_9TREM|nr:unnamed protein product [Schistosoma margrebowiei]